MDERQGSTPPGRFERIDALLVDDDALMRSVSAATFDHLGVGSVRTADSGRAALDIVDSAAQPPDVIFCDLDMPEMDGIELLRHIVQRRYQGAVVFISSTNGGVLRAAEQTAKAHHLNTLGTIEKPMSTQRIEEVLLQVLARKLPRPSAATPDIALHELEAAVAGNQFRLYYQPKVELQGLRPTGGEALLRWFHPTYGSVPPVRFLPLAESSNFITTITDWVLGEGLQQLASWHAQGHDLSLAINLSMRDLDVQNWPVRFFAVTKSLGIDPSRITLELTESAAIGNTVNSLETLARLRLKGVQLSIDDFGTGFSSLKKLTDIPFTELKIDRQFIQAAPFDAGARAVSEACAGLAREFSINCVAEGIETVQQLEFARAIGCHEAQGYLFAPALANDDFLKWCTR